MGLNSAAASHAGIPIFKTVLVVAILSGGMAGMAGVTETAGLKGYLTLDLSLGLGMQDCCCNACQPQSYRGDIFEYLFSINICWRGCNGRAMNVPTYLADVIVALTVLCILLTLYSCIIKFCFWS